MCVWPVRLDIYLIQVSYSILTLNFYHHGKDYATAPTAEKLPVLPSQATVSKTLNIDPHANTWPDLDKVKVKPLNLDVEYWRPEVEGESKTLVFMEVRRG